MSSRNEDRFLERSKLMILAVVARVCDVPVALVESECTKKRVNWEGKGKKEAGQTASFQVDHLSHGDPNDTLWPARGGVGPHTFEGLPRECRMGRAGGSCEATRSPFGGEPLQMS